MQVSVSLWIATIGVLIVLIAVDFFVGGRKPREVSIRDAGVWTAVWVGLAGLFGGFLWWHSGGAKAGEFFAGYVTEKALSVDNLFVFVLIMAKFAVPKVQQQRVLLFGVLVALVLRAGFIAAGAALVTSFSWTFYLFGAFLVWTAVKLVREHGAEQRESRLLGAIRRRLPVTVSSLLVVMAAIGLTDLLFALDSIPAIFGLTQDAYIVFTANAFALMGLRQLYFLLGGLLSRLVHLSYGLAVILGFIGVKLVLHALHESGVPAPEIGTPLSLGLIALVLAVTTTTSLLASRPRPLDGPHAEAFTDN